VLYLTAVKETQEKLQLCQRYGKHHELCGKAADLPIAVPLQFFVSFRLNKNNPRDFSTDQ